ncbi:MAG: dehydrogenase [Phycisphaerae bacterium]|nr:dehydrogenase [Phycisphaerae bacterium]
MSRIPKELDKPRLLGLYEKLYLVRRFEETVQELYRDSRLPGFVHMYVGEEASAVGVCAHLRRDDWVASTHRGDGHALAKGVPAKNLLAELNGRADGPGGGRGGSMHVIAPEAGLLGTNGIVAAGAPLATGAALSAKLRGTDNVAVAFFGDGASNHGAVLESINFAGARKLPVVFVCENNLYATSTPISVATVETDIYQRAVGLGVSGQAVEGYDVLAVWQAAKDAVDRARRGEGPTFLELKTYRLCGHGEGEPIAGHYRTMDEVESWRKRDAVRAFRSLLLKEKIATAGELNAVEESVRKEVAEAVEFAEASPHPDPATLHDYLLATPLNPPTPAVTTSATKTQNWIEAVRDGIAEEMRRDPNIVYLGEGVGERGGCFAHTKNLWQEFGGERVIDTPISELAFTGASVGASATGCRAIADLMFADFLFEAGSQIVHQATKLRYLSNGKVSVPMVLRAPIGVVKNSGAHHSGAYYSMWSHVPGLIVAVPSTPADAKGMMKNALRASDPVLFMEHKVLFSTKGDVPDGDALVPFGKARIVREGADMTLVACSLMVHRCLEAAELLQGRCISCEVIDLRTIMPLDVDTVAASLAKTHRLLIVDEDWAPFGVGAELTAAMMELAFDELDAPIGRLNFEPVPYPFATVLEDAMRVDANKIIAGVENVITGIAPVPYRIKVTGQTATSVSPITAVPTTPPPTTKSTAVISTTPKPAPTNGTIPLLMPNVDLTITEAKVVRWVRRVGESFVKGDCVVEVETDKAVLEVEAPRDGTLVEITAGVDTVVALGETLGRIKPKS